MIYLFLAEGFEETEAVGTVDILRRAKLDVLTVSLADKAVRGAHAIVVQADITIDEVEPDRAQMFILPGGMPGAANLEKNEKVRALLEFARDNSLFIAAICAAPAVLGRMGLLQGKDATCFPSYAKELIGAKLSEKRAVRDGNIITSVAPGTTWDFAAEIVRAFGKDPSEILRSMRCYD
ncbi:MAG: DJ-1/PfpI family protein [Clostridia bacterium]|nr:DJ-1/PfpI family protein [Clostridia bacterium]